MFNEILYAGIEKLESILVVVGCLVKSICVPLPGLVSWVGLVGPLVEAGSTPGH